MRLVPLEIPVVLTEVSATGFSVSSWELSLWADPLQAQKSSQASENNTMYQSSDFDAH